MNSIRQRLVVFFIIIATAILGLSGAYSYWNSRDELMLDLRQTGEALRSRLETSLPGPVWNFDSQQIDRILDSEMRSPKVQLIAILHNNELLAGREINASGEIQRLNTLPGKNPLDIEFDLFFQDRLQPPIGKAVIRLSTAPIHDQLRLRVIERLVEIALLVGVMVLALSRSLAVFLGRPLQQLQERL